MIFSIMVFPMVAMTRLLISIEGAQQKAGRGGGGGGELCESPLIHCQNVDYYTQKGLLSVETVNYHYVRYTCFVI
jgi:hypothetical protein